MRPPLGVPFAVRLIFHLRITNRNCVFPAAALMPSKKADTPNRTQLTLDVTETRERRALILSGGRSNCTVAASFDRFTCAPLSTRIA